MTKEYKIKLVENLKNEYLELEKQFDCLTKVIGGDYDSPLGNAVWKAFDSYINLVAKELEDNTEFLSWFIFENRFGNKKLSCYIDKKEYKIETVEDFVNFIEIWKDK